VAATPDDEFDDIVADLRDERFTEQRPRRGLFVAGVVCCVVAVAVLLFGGIKGAVIAVIPWIAGMILVIVGRPR
jgi:hypothetical protein